MPSHIVHKDEQAMDAYQLLQRYLDVCNQALDANKDRFPYKQILGSAQNLSHDALIEVSIIDDRPTETFVLSLNETKIVGQPHDNCTNCECDAKWRINRSYLEEVINHPEDYIRNPAKIDWEWMQGHHSN